MPARGVLFAIEADDAERLLEAGDDDEVMGVIEEVEENWDEANLAETDKAWDAIHRALTNGLLEWSNGGYPLNHVILGGRRLYQGDDYVAVLKTPEQVRDVAAAVRSIDDAGMAALYDRNVPHDYDPNHGDEDRTYTVDWFAGVRELFVSAADSGRWVLFTVDQ
jgi:hypothetical protein